MLNAASSLIVRSQRLSIRTAKVSDLESIFHIHSVDAVNQYLPYDTWGSMDDAHAWFTTINQRREQQDAEQFVILERETLIGTIIVFNADQPTRTAEIGYVLARDFWRQRYMSEALSAFIPALSAKLSLQRLEAKVDRDNIGSSKLLLKLGFEQNGCEREPNGVKLDLFSKRF